MKNINLSRIVARVKNICAGHINGLTADMEWSAGEVVNRICQPNWWVKITHFRWGDGEVVGTVEIDLAGAKLISDAGEELISIRCELMCASSDSDEAARAAANLAFALVAQAKHNVAVAHHHSRTSSGKTEEDREVAK